MFEPSRPTPKRFQVGEFAKRVGKTVRAMHLYEELGLLLPVERSKGGFRLYDETSIERARWIVKLQNVGFTLAEIRRLVSDSEAGDSQSGSNSQARGVLSRKLSEVETQLAKLEGSKTDLVEAMRYLSSLQSLASDMSPANSEQASSTDEDARRLEGSSEHR